MGENEKLILADRSVVPDDDLIFSLIGERKIFWQDIMNYLSNTYNDVSGSWNYYNDGKQWLFKLVRKKKTIFWAGILTGTFRITFYFGDKAESIIYDSLLPRSIKDEFRTAKKYGSIRPVSFIVKDRKDFDNILIMIDIKYKMK
jgi:hypothetical protein